MGADRKANTWELVRAPSGLLQQLQRRVALEALGESGCSLGTEDVISQTARRGVWLVVRSVNGPIDTAHHPPPNPAPAVSRTTGSVPKEEPLSRRVSGATRRCNRSSKPSGPLKPALKCLPWCQRPLTLLSTHLCSHARSLLNNSLGPEGCAALVEGFKGNSTLQSLE